MARADSGCTGAGALISRTAIERAPFSSVHAYIRSLPVQSGDALLSRTFWFQMSLAPTDPGVHTDWSQSVDGDGHIESWQLGCCRQRRRGALSCPKC